ncbi:SDR family oxidoreductase [Enterobacter hormaechei]|uniref:SDR family oxidoreductase n=1 Tax=Enterobacter hormaechei TaxID=158836 RepID=UPI001CEF77FD|nr:SDR family oxidoreductase [Enterobacter hormaechei]
MTETPLNNRTALITGANKGIGLAIAKGLARQGFRVWITARDRRRGEEAVQYLQAEGLTVQLLIMDVTDDVSVQQAAATLSSATNSLDILVNNAGVLLDASATPSETRMSELKHTFEVNFFGPIRVTQAFLPLLQAAENASVIMLGSGLGSLTLITDETSIYSTVNLLSYSASKVALNAATVCFARELADKGIKVNVVEPGNVRTDLNGHTGVLTPEQGATTIIRIALAEGHCPTGKFFGPDGRQPW